MTLFGLPKNIKEKLSYMGLGAGMALIAVPIITGAGASTGGNPDPYHREIAEKRVKVTYPWYPEGLTPLFVFRGLDDTHKPWIAEQSCWLYLWDRVNPEVGLRMQDPAASMTILDNKDGSRSLWFGRMDAGDGDRLIVEIDGKIYPDFFKVGDIGLRGIVI